MKRFAFAFIIGAFAAATAVAQEHDHSAAVATARQTAPLKATAENEHPPEIFCGTMKTGQLCSLGTVTLLGLNAEKRETWIAAVRQYNKAVNEAIVALQGQAKGTLSAAQIAEVNRWFAIGVNPQINQLLAATTNERAAK